MGYCRTNFKWHRPAFYFEFSCEDCCCLVQARKCNIFNTFIKKILETHIDLFYFFKRIIATTVLTVINILGVGAGFLIPSAFVSDEDSVDDTKQNFFTLLLTEAIMTTVLIAPVFIFFKEKPPTPPRFYYLI